MSTATTQKVDKIIDLLSSDQRGHYSRASIVATDFLTIIISSK